MKWKMKPLKSKICNDDDCLRNELRDEIPNESKELPKWIITRKKTS